MHTVNTISTVTKNIIVEPSAEWIKRLYFSLYLNFSHLTKTLLGTIKQAFGCYCHTSITLCAFNKYKIKKLIAFYADYLSYF